MSLFYIEIGITCGITCGFNLSLFYLEINITLGVIYTFLTTPLNNNCYAQNAWYDRNIFYIIELTISLINNRSFVRINCVDNSDTRRLLNVGFLLAHRLKCLSNNKSIFGQRFSVSV